MSNGKNNAELIGPCPKCGGDLLGEPGDYYNECPHCKVYVLGLTQEFFSRLARVVALGIGRTS